MKFGRKPHNNGFSNLPPDHVVQIGLLLILMIGLSLDWSVPLCLWLYLSLRHWISG